ncbi:hypothetical protein HZS_1338 [Henneguya salminicola]|nr:hypothetical protein HZS_1338 [Henneguya salminicola]
MCNFFVLVILKYLHRRRNRLKNKILPQYSRNITLSSRRSTVDGVWRRNAVGDTRFYHQYHKLELYVLLI